MAAYEGACSRCGRKYQADHEDLVVCDCWETCPLCGQTMEPYDPDLAANTYGKDGKRDLEILRICHNSAAHFDNSPFFSIQKLMQVELEKST